MTRFATKFGAFEIDSLPSQCQVAICHGFYVKPEYRGKGLSHDLKMYQNTCVEDLGYDYAICTVAKANAAQKAVLAKAGWRSLAVFFSKRQNEHIEVWGQDEKGQDEEGQVAVRADSSTETLEVRDGSVTQNSVVWWRSKEGPKLVKAGYRWSDIKECPYAYQLAAPAYTATQVVYLD